MSHTVTAITAPHVMPRIAAEIKAMLADGAVTVSVKAQTRKRAQNDKLHAMIADIARQVTFAGKRYSSEVWKAMLVEQFDNDKSAMGEPLSNPAKTVISLDTKRVITVRPSTTTFSVKEAADFIEFLYAQGADMMVRWSDLEKAAWDQMNDQRRT